MTLTAPPTERPCGHPRQTFDEVLGIRAAAPLAVLPCADTRCSPRGEVKGPDGKPLAVKRVQTLKGWKWVGR